MIFRRLIFLLTAMLICSTIINAKDKPIIQFPFILNNDHIIIKLTLNHSPPLNFIFDSGAGATLLNKKTADSLGLKAKFYRTNVGVSGTHKVGVNKGVKLAIDGEKLGNINVLSSNTYFEELDNGEEVHGVIGYAVLVRYITEIDYEGGLISLYARDSYKYDGNGYELPIYIVQNLPIGKATIDMYNGTSFEGDFMIDTGSRTEIIINSPTVVAFDMAENIGTYYTVRATIGTSSRRTKMRYGRLSCLGLANYKFDDVPVALSSDNKGVLSLDLIDGIIGNRMLKRFNIIFNYKDSKIYLKPNILIGKEYEVNLSGLSIAFVGGKPFLKNVVDRSPADKAGLRNGDEIISINTVLVENMPPGKIRQSFLITDKKINLVIRRNNKYKYTELKLKPLI